MYSPFGAGGAVGRRPTRESSFFSLLRYDTHFPTPGSTLSYILLNAHKIHCKRKEIKSILICKKKEMKSIVRACLCYLDIHFWKTFWRFFTDDASPCCFALASSIKSLRRSFSRFSSHWASFACATTTNKHIKENRNG